MFLQRKKDMGKSGRACWSVPNDTRGFQALTNGDPSLAKAPTRRAVLESVSRMRLLGRPTMLDADLILGIG